MKKVTDVPIRIGEDFVNPKETVYESNRTQHQKRTRKLGF